MIIDWGRPKESASLTLALTLTLLTLHSVGGPIEDAS